MVYPGVVIEPIDLIERDQQSPLGDCFGRLISSMILTAPMFPFFSFRKPHPLVDIIGLLDYFLPVGLIGTGVHIVPRDVVDQPIWPAAWK